MDIFIPISLSLMASIMEGKKTIALAPYSQYRNKEARNKEAKKILLACTIAMYKFLIEYQSSVRWT
jgi:hypothetical protein